SFQKRSRAALVLHSNSLLELHFFAGRSQQATAKEGSFMTLLKWIALMNFLQCFAYKDANIGLAFELGITITHDRMVFFIIFILAKSIPHSRKKLKFLSCTFLVLGTYLAINGLFERFGPYTLVWPKYILDPDVGVQFGRTRGPFASSESLGGALIVTFLFDALCTTRAKGIQLYWAYIMTPMTAGVIYTTNQRSAWLGFGFSLVL